jgi:hypothetical protein
MRRRVIQGLVVVGVGSLFVAQAAVALVQAAAPEIDAGSAASALTILVGALSLLGERLRHR